MPKDPSIVSLEASPPSVRLKDLQEDTRFWEAIESSLQALNRSAALLELPVVTPENIGREPD